MLPRSICTAFILITTIISGSAQAQASEPTSAAFAALDWTSFDIEIHGDGDFFAVADPFVFNYAEVHSDALNLLSRSEQVFMPAYAAHPWTPDNIGAAALDDEASLVAAAVDLGLAHAF